MCGDSLRADLGSFRGDTAMAMDYEDAVFENFLQLPHSNTSEEHARYQPE